MVSLEKQSDIPHRIFAGSALQCTLAEGSQAKLLFPQRFIYGGRPTAKAQTLHRIRCSRSVSPLMEDLGLRATSHRMPLSGRLC
jgi:hypothetical protein